MIFFADTADPKEIDYCFSVGVNDGITTNPKIMETTGDLSKGFEGACRAILSKYPNVPVSLETDLRGLSVETLESTAEQVRDVLLLQAAQLRSWQDNVVVKIPICSGGILATRELSRQGVKTNVTACMNPYQALEAARAGATYVSLFANRMLDYNILELANGGRPLTTLPENWKDIVKQNKDKYNERAWQVTLSQIDSVARALDGTISSLIVGSIRSPQDIYRLAKVRPQVITIPTGIVRGLENIPAIKQTARDFVPCEFDMGSSLVHPITTYTLAEFEKAADSYRKSR
jgi:transaldolase